jgi:hypothetical protein
MVRQAHIQAEKWRCIVFRMQVEKDDREVSRCLSMGNGSAVPVSSGVTRPWDDWRMRRTTDAFRGMDAQRVPPKSAPGLCPFREARSEAAEAERVLRNPHTAALIS